MVLRQLSSITLYHYAAIISTIVRICIYTSWPLFLLGSRGLALRAKSYRLGNLKLLIYDPNIVAYTPLAHSLTGIMYNHSTLYTL